jgi:threonine dehydratase
VWLKAENLQRAGAFKIRGALNATIQARAHGEVPAAGVLTYSSGNHGQAVALAARILGLKATIVAPEDIREVKRSAIVGYGARLETAGLTSEDRRVRAEEIARETGARIIRPYDHPDIIAGQGTLALEALEDLRSVRAIVVPVGGGGLVSGIAIAVKALRPSMRVIGVEPEGADDFRRSLEAGRRITIDPPHTIADGLRAVIPGELTFPAAQRYVDEIVTVEDSRIREAQQILLERAKLLVEPSGAVSVAAYMKHGAAWDPGDIVLVLSGGNTTLRDLELPK